MTTTTTSLEDRAKELAGNWKKFDSFAWFRRREIEDAESWGIYYTHNRDSGLLDQSNADVISKALEPFTDGDDPDVIMESHSHWAVGHVDGFSMRVFKDGEITEAFRVFHELEERMDDYPVLNEIRDMYKKQGKEPPKEMASTVFYNRGVLIAALHVEAIRNALKAKPDGKITGEDTKKGFEKISNFTLGGLVPPLKVTPQDHEGGGLVQIWQVKGGKFVKVTDWFHAYQDVVAKHIKEAAAKK